MKSFLVALLFLALPAFSQTDGPVFTVINFIPPALDATGHTIAFGSTVSPDGTIGSNNDLYVGIKKLVENVTSVGLTSDGSRALFTDVVGAGERVAAVDTSTGAVQPLSVDTEGCIRPAVVCPACFFACVVTPHATVDGSKVLYAVRRNQPFYVVNADGTGLFHLPVYSGTLAPAPQRVISSKGVLAFMSAAPSGPTFAAAATDVYLINLDGTNLENITKFGNAAIFANNATISADGSTAVFETNYSGTAKPSPLTQIWEARQDGSPLRQLSSGPFGAWGPSISADGKTVVFLQSGQIKVVQLAADGQPVGQPVAITTLHHSIALSPAISDDGLRVAFLIGPELVPTFGVASPPSSLPSRPLEFPAGAVYEINTDGTGVTALYAPRAISPSGVVSAAGSRLPPSPGGIFSVYGINFTGDQIANAGGFPLPDVLAGASVLVNGSKVPLLSVSPRQVNAQLPQETPAQSGNFQVSFVDGTKTPAQETKIVATAPDLFLTASFQVAAFHAGTGIPVDRDHPTHAGETLEMYGTGLGATNPVVPAGQPSPADPVAHTIALPELRIGDVPALVLFSGLTPRFAGVYQVNIVVPGLSPGRYFVTLRDTAMNLNGEGTIAVE